MLGQSVISFVQRSLPGSFRSLVPQSVRLRVARLLGKLDDRDEALAAAKAATDAQNWEHAARLWDGVLARSRGYGSELAAARLSEALRILGRFDEAEEALSRKHRDSSGAAIVTEHARIAMARADWPKALHFWLDCVDRPDFGSHNCVDVSRTYRMLRRYDEADDLIARFLSDNPDDLKFLSEYARIAADRKHWPQAAERWRQVVNKYGAAAPTEACLGLYLALVSLGDEKGAADVFQFYRADCFARSYERWVSQQDRLGSQDRLLIRRQIDALPYHPKFSILLRVYSAPHGLLRSSLESIRSQIYDDWELCVTDDASPDHEVRAILADYAQKDIRIRPVYRDVHGGIAAASNSALAEASGDWVAVMDHGDVLAPHALYLLAERLNQSPNATIIYSDEDRIDESGQRSDPYFKPDFNYDLFLGQNLFNRLAAYRADLARSVNGFRDGYDGAEDWDFALRVLDAAPTGTVEHVPHVLCHSSQTALANPLAPAASAAQRAVNEHFARRGTKAAAIPTGSASDLRIQWALPDPRPLVSVVIPTRDRADLLSACVEGLLKRTDYEPMELVIVDNDSSDPDALSLIQNLRQMHQATVVDVPEPFNFSRLINLGVAASSGDVLLFLNNDIEVIHPDWLDELVSQAMRLDVGAVGAKLYYDNETVQHGGVFLGVGGVARNAFRLFPRDSDGYGHWLQLTRQVSCATAACIAVRRPVFDEVGGLDEENLAVDYNDVDFCLRLAGAGYRIVWTPYAELYHHESISRGSIATPEQAARSHQEETYIMTMWGGLINKDPFYNPNLSLGSEGFGLAETSRARKPWLE